MKNQTNNTLHLHISRICCVFTFFYFLSGFSNASAQQIKTIVFLAGPKDHAPPSRHEYEKDLTVLQHCLDSATNLKGIKIVTKLIVNRTEHDIEDIKNASAIVILSSSESSAKTQTHPLFPPSGDNKRSYDPAIVKYLDQVDSLHKAGMGIVVMHWAVAADNLKARQLYTDWFGGGWMPDYSMNPLGMWTVTPVESGKKHPIMRGVGAWTYKDEVFSKFMVIPEDPHRTDLLFGEAPKTNQGPVAQRCITWAYENGNARGLIWGGTDYHSAMLNENYRRFLLNAIVWAAGIEVPKGGVKSDAKQLQLIPARKDMFDKL